MRHCDQTALLLFSSLAIAISGLSGISGSCLYGQEQSPTAPFAALQDELREATRAKREQLSAATTEEERTELRKINTYRQFDARFLELARNYGGQPTAMEAVLWLAESAPPGEEVDLGLDIIEQHQLDDPRVGKLCRLLTYKLTPRVERFLLTVAEKHPDQGTRGEASLALAHFLKNLNRSVESLRNKPDWLKWAQTMYPAEVIVWMRELDPAELTRRFDATCDQLIDQYADVADAGFHEKTGRDQSLAESARILRFTVHAAGQPAPETVGKLADGSRLSLADLLGQVVVLMFSADWCGPCKQVYGQLREQMRLYADKPFTVVTVMADRDVSTVKHAIGTGEITWPAIWDGEDGPIASHWGVEGYPTIYVIDRDGRIHSQGLRDDPLDDEVANLLGIAPASRARPDKRTRIWRLSFPKQEISEEDLPKLLEGYTELRELDLSEHPLTDSSLVHLLPLKKLEFVNLQHTGITDKGLQTLKGLPNLKRLYLELVPGHPVTQIGIRALEDELPNLQVLIITH